MVIPKVGEPATRPSIVQRCFSAALLLHRLPSCRRALNLTYQHNMTEVYVHIAGKNNGPYLPEEVRTRIEMGTFNANDLACHEQHPQWATIGELFPELLVKADKPGPAKKRFPWKLVGVGLVMTIWTIGVFWEGEPEKENPSSLPSSLATGPAPEKATSETEPESKAPQVASQSAETPTQSEEQREVVQPAGPTDEIIRMGIKQYNPEWSTMPLRRGQPLVSQGSRLLPAGTVVYPVKIIVKESDIVFHLFEDGFGEWMCAYNDFHAVRACKGLSPVPPDDEN